MSLLQALTQTVKIKIYKKIFNLFPTGTRLTGEKKGQGKVKEIEFVV